MATAPIHLVGNNAPIGEEVTLGERALEVVGDLPADLVGTFLRNGPNPRTGWSSHLFAGDGAGDVGPGAAGLAIAGGVVHVGAAGAVRAFDATGCGAAECVPVASVPMPGTGAGTVIVSGGHLYVNASDGIHAYAPTGAP